LPNFFIISLIALAFLDLLPGNKAPQARYNGSPGRQAWEDAV
jgi:hypothetical protein